MLWLGIENKTHLIRFRKMTRLTVLVLVATDMATGAPTTCQKYLLFFFCRYKTHLEIVPRSHKYKQLKKYPVLPHPASHITIVIVETQTHILELHIPIHLQS